MYSSLLEYRDDLIAVADLGFLKGDSAQPEVESKKKKGVQFLHSLFPLSQPCFPFFLTKYIFFIIKLL